MMMNYLDKATVSLDGTDYLVGYPNVGQQLEIENLKLVLSTGNYSQYARSATKTALQLLNLIDAISYFYVLIPELKSKIDINKFTEIDALMQSKLSKAYIKFNTEFLVKIDEELNKQLDSESGE